MKEARQELKKGLRKLARWVWRLPLWQRAFLIVAVPLSLLNLSVAFFGKTVVFPLSPFYVKEKAVALELYAEHRLVSLFSTDPPANLLAQAAARRYGLPAGLLEAVLDVESGSDPHRISAAGAMGPAQLTASTARLLGVRDPFDSATAIDGGARYLSQQLKRFGDIRLAAAAYNAGPGAVNGSVPHNGETGAYVERVVAEYHRRRPPVLPRVVKAPHGSCRDLGKAGENDGSRRHCPGKNH